MLYCRLLLIIMMSMTEMWTPLVLLCLWLHTRVFSRTLRQHVSNDMSATVMLLSCSCHAAVCG